MSEHNGLTDPIVSESLGGIYMVGITLQRLIANILLDDSKRFEEFFVASAGVFYQRTSYPSQANLAIDNTSMLAVVFNFEEHAFVGRVAVYPPATTQSDHTSIRMGGHPVITAVLRTGGGKIIETPPLSSPLALTALQERFMPVFTLGPEEQGEARLIATQGAELSLDAIEFQRVGRLMRQRFSGNDGTIGQSPI